MTHLIFGSDTYSSYTKLSEMKQKFIELHGIDNLVIKQGYELAGINIENVLFAQTLLGGDRLVVFKNAIYECDDETRKNLIKILSNELPSDLTVVFYETNKIDRRLALFKLLNQSASLIEFNLPIGIDRVNKVKQMMATKQVFLSDSQLRNLIERTTNFWQIHNELDKLSAFGLGEPIADESFRYLVSGNVEVDTFALLDAIATSNTKVANRILNLALIQGENEIRMLGAIASQLRNLIRIKDMSESGMNHGNISKHAGIHPYVVQKTLAQVSRIKRIKIVSAYQKLVKIDWRIKTGVYQASDALDLLVVELAGQRVSGLAG